MDTFSPASTHNFIARPSQVEPRLLDIAENMADLDPQQKIALINENLQEVLRPDIIENAIVKEDRPLAIYWGNVRYNCLKGTRGY